MNPGIPQTSIPAAPLAQGPLHVITLAHNGAVTVNGMTYWANTMSCQSGTNVPHLFAPHLTLVPPGTWQINPSLTIVALA